jgi:hypothetical protein
MVSLLAASITSSRRSIGHLFAHTVYKEATSIYYRNIWADVVPGRGYFPSQSCDRFPCPLHAILFISSTVDRWTRSYTFLYAILFLLKTSEQIIL